MSKEKLTSCICGWFFHTLGEKIIKYHKQLNWYLDIYYKIMLLILLRQATKP